MPRKTEQTYYWVVVFRKVLRKFNELRSSNGTLSVEQFYTTLANGTSILAVNVNVVAPTPSDFICDVTKSAQRALTPAEYKIFNKFYLEQEDVIYIDVNKLSPAFRKIEQKVGRMLLERRIYPIQNYFEAKHIAGKRT